MEKNPKTKQNKTKKPCLAALTPLLSCGLFPSELSSQSGATYVVVVWCEVALVYNNAIISHITHTLDGFMDGRTDGRTDR